MKSLVANQNGSFALIGKGGSRYEGVFFWLNQKMFKSICSFAMDRSYGEIKNDLCNITRQRDDITESFWFVPDLPVFFYEPSKLIECDLLLDCKENYDNRQWARRYSITKEKSVVLIHFEKKNDPKEPEHKEYDFWLALHGPGSSLNLVEDWVEQNYEDDKSRNSPPFSRWVFNLGKLKTKGLAISCAEKKHDAIWLVENAWKNRAKFAQQAKSNAVKWTKLKSSVADEALAYAQYSLSCLKIKGGLFAGLPWFHQRWARDELISCGGLIAMGKKTLAKQIVRNYLQKVLPSGKVQGTLTKEIADGAWLFFRGENLLDDLTSKDKEILKEKLTLFLKQIKLENNLVLNGPGETWMDAVYDGDSREGACIEIQALTLAACRLAKKFRKKVSWEKDLLAETKQQFWTGSYLKDRANDDTIRPNVFIAAYVYPDLLTKEEWIKCFDTILPKLWLDWGGLSTIDKDHHLFANEHTGEDPASYHRGDSWFWINNLAALVLARIDKERYADYINKILEASSKEILELGAIGHHAELSNAKELKPNGCIAQAWSAAMFVELVQELS